MKKVLITGGIFAMLCVAIGAFGAHALKDILGTSASTFETGVQYQMFHSIGILVCGLLLMKENSRLYTAAAVLFSIGIILFSGSLYTLSITKISILGMITPFGGVAFLAGWLCLIIGAARCSTAKLIF
ncbi:DUF423 domain-containing protein [Listeria valentina]|uniref:DUF423 domain-containing protein n=1 Tax=Listeria valentina TaxID=2705293 RepID=UPI00142F96D2|nr:DUF423 domain-containing protein [Listeria valentina]